MIRKELINTSNVIDSLELARNKYPGASNSLDALCKRFNIDLSKRIKHNALLDCELLREVYINILDMKEPKFSLPQSNPLKTIADSTNHYKKIIEISELELKRHKEFLKKDLKKNYY